MEIRERETVLFAHKTMFLRLASYDARDAFGQIKSVIVCFTPTTCVLCVRVRNNMDSASFSQKRAPHTHLPFRDPLVIAQTIHVMTKAAAATNERPLSRKCTDSSVCVGRSVVQSVELET